MKVMPIRLILILAVSVFMMAVYGCSEEDLIKPEAEPESIWEEIQGIGSGAIDVMKFDSQDNLYVLKHNNKKVLFRSPDYGNTWAKTDTVSVDTTYVGNISSFCFSGDDLLVGTREGKIFISSDNGNVFTLVDSIGRPQLRDIRHMGYSPDGYIYAAVYGQAVYRAEHPDSSWLMFGNLIENKDFTSMEIDSDGCIYLGCWAGDSYKSCDNGETWQALNKIKDYELSTITSLDKVNHNELVCGFTDGFAVYRGDSAWVIKNAGFPGGGSDIRCLGVTSEDKIYAGTIYDGVYRATWGVWEWTPLNQGLDLAELKVTNIAIDSQDRVYIGTVDNGIWRGIW